MSTHVVWENTIDNGRFAAKVESPDDDGYTGTLTVTHVPDETLIFTEEVAVSFGARFGPDIADLAVWRERVIAAVDKFYEIKGETPPSGSS